MNSFLALQQSICFKTFTDSSEADMLNYLVFLPVGCILWRSYNAAVWVCHADGLFTKQFSGTTV
jgi:hypothetical protein